jgi:hypothetical protein
MAGTEGIVAGRPPSKHFLLQLALDDVMNRKESGMRNVVLSAFLVAASWSTTHEVGAAEPAGCAPAGGLKFICGIQNPEDLALIPNTRWMITSSMAAGGGLHLVDTGKKEAQAFFSASSGANQDKILYGNCPGPVDVNKASFHGLSLRPARNSHYKLYATQHGSRESIEVFDIDATGATPKATWVGCVTMPGKMAANSVSSFSDGSILATVLTLPDKNFADSLIQKNTGAVFLWKPDTAGFIQIPGTELPSNNGIDVAPDDSEFYVVSSGAKQIVAFSRDNPARALRRAQFTEFTPDNVHWTADGKLISAGMIENEPACGGPVKADAKGAVNLTGCARGTMAASVDPRTMKVTEVLRTPAIRSFSMASSALPVGDEIWIGSFHADRLAYRPAP